MILHVKSGRELVIKINNEIITLAKEYQYQFTQEPVQVTSVSSGKYKEFRPGKLTFQLAAVHLVTRTDDNFGQLMSYFRDRAMLEIEIFDEALETYVYKFDALIISLLQTAHSSRWAGMNFGLLGSGSIDQIAAASDQWVDEGLVDQMIDEVGNFTTGS